LVHIYFTQRNLLLNSKQQEKMIGHHTRLRKSDDLPLWRGPAVKKKPPFFNARALITREIMRRRDAQCNTGNNLNRALNNPAQALRF